MSTVRELHHQSMQFAQQAMVARSKGDSQSAIDYAKLALDLEMEAASRISKDKASEPTRSILYKGAASLAYQAYEYEIAERLIFEALSGFPPPRIKQELKDLYEQINFATHLQVRDVVLQDAQVQLALTGNDVGSGLIPYSSFRERVGAFITLIDRTMRRLMGQTYQVRGGGSLLTRPFIPLISSPRIGSFAVTIEVAQKTEVATTFLTSGQNIIDRVVNGLALVQNQDTIALREEISDERYYINFLSMAHQLAPDGEQIKRVGLTTSSREVAFTIPKHKVAIPIPSLSTADTAHEVTMLRYQGVLDEASARGNGRLGFTSDQGSTIDLTVQEGMDDLVRAHFNYHVEVVVQRNGRRNLLLQIDKIGDE